MKIAMRHRSTVKLASCFLIAIVIAMLCLGPVGALSSRQQKVLNNLKIRAQETGQVTSMKDAIVRKNMNDMKKSIAGKRAQIKEDTSQKDSNGEGPKLGDAAATSNDVTGQATSKADTIGKEDSIKARA